MKRMEYRAIFWDPEADEDFDVGFKEFFDSQWKVFNMFLVYEAEREAYRVILYREIDVKI